MLCVLGEARTVRMDCVIHSEVFIMAHHMPYAVIGVEDTAVKWKLLPLREFIFKKTGGDEYYREKC